MMKEKIVKLNDDEIMTIVARSRAAIHVLEKLLCGKDKDITEYTMYDGLNKTICNEISIHESIIKKLEG